MCVLYFNILSLIVVITVIPILVIVVVNIVALATVNMDTIIIVQYFHLVAMVLASHLHQQSFQTTGNSVSMSELKIGDQVETGCILFFWEKNTKLVGI